MNSATDPPSAVPPAAEEPTRSSPPPGPATWAEAIGGMAASRAGLLRIEAADFARSSFRRVIFGAAAAVCALFAWGLFVAGAVGVVVLLSGWPWPYVMLGACGLHILVALALVQALRSPLPSAFPLTREEFLKDRAWLETLQNKKKSGS